ncbi:integrase catalytic domain-containing protein [Trichonephila clavipes]|nr:integrase catalytic domain-containing protein [Trichonephila clavipes]
MHVFVDACKEAYATCIIFRSNTSQGVKVALVGAKARVAPLKQLSHIGWEGPLWLVESLDRDTWPITKLPDYDTSEISLERKNVRLGYLNLSEEMLPWYARKFSKFNSILRLVAWVLGFINNVRSRISDRKKGQLSLDELESAEIQLIRSVQAQSFTDEN